MTAQPRHYFRPKARLMVLLGDQLIKNHTLALFELIKNAYDADASRVDVTLLDIDQDDGAIEVEDDGIGMSHETVTGIWLEPAHGHKADARQGGQRTEKGRLPVGEKGVGRFAVHRLGAIISMVTRQAGHDEVVVNIDWESFLKNDYLDQSEVEVTTRKPVVFVGSKTGTRITISRLRQQWRRGDVRRLYRSVISMTPPLLDDNEVAKNGCYDERPDNEFSVNFVIEPDKGWLAGLFDPAFAVSQALFKFEFALDDEGLTYKYQFKPYESIVADYPELIAHRCAEQHLKTFDFFKYAPAEDAISLKQRKKRNSMPLLGKSDENKKGLGIGPVKGQILGFDFDKEIYNRYLKDETGGLSDYLREQGGIRVYRDGLRVYSYGEPGDDWLHLDHRRIQGPTRKLGSRQIMGAIYLDLEDSSELIEKTNREGFVENEAYAELVHAMLSILAQFEAERNKDKRLLKNILTLAPGVKKIDCKRKPTADELIEELHKTVISENAYKPLEPIVKEVTKAYHETRDVLMSAAGAGMGLVTVFHELERGVRNLHQAIQDKTDLAALQLMSTELVSLLRGAMYMVATKQMETISASRLVGNVLLTQERRLKRHAITFLNGFERPSCGDFDVRVIRRMLTAALVNLIDNAIYWTDDGTDEERYIWIGPSMDLEGPAIVLADSGPGFVDDPTDIVQPFFTRKPHGMGIGLYYADMVMKSHSGRLAFPELGAVERPAVVNGACIAMVFPRGGNS